MLQTILLEPIYNTLVFLIEKLPGNYLWVSILVLTFLVRLILFPFSRNVLINQRIQKKLQPVILDLREKIKDPAAQTKAMMKLYKVNKSNPFTGCLVLLIQLPILLALYNVFSKDLVSQSSFLYSGLSLPEYINNTFLGISLLVPSSFLAFATGIIQFLQLKYSPAMRTTDDKKQKEDLVKKDKVLSPEEMQKKMMDSMQRMMKYFLPIMITLFALKVPAAVALYWLMSTLFTLGQELFVFRFSNDPEVIIPDDLYEKAA